MSVDASAVARVVGITTEFKNLGAGQVQFLPQRIALIAQGATASVYSTDKAQITSAVDAANTYGFGSPIHLMAQQLFPANGDGVGVVPVTVYPLVDDGAGVAASGTVTPSGTITEQFTFRVKVNNILSDAVLVAAGATVGRGRG